MTHKAFVASTYEDLRDHRARVIQILCSCGILVDPMEHWTATTHEPKVFSQARLEGCDLCVLLVAFRRGHIPRGETKSITQLEYEAALQKGIDLLVYLLDDSARWEDRFDERRADPEIGNWRAELREQHGVGFFGPDPASITIEAALVRWALEQVEATPRQLRLPDNLVGLEEEPARVLSSQVSQIQQDLSAVIRLGRRDVLVVDLRAGIAWWSTRLFLLASLVQDYTGVRLIAIADNSKYIGVTTPTVLAAGLAAAQPDLQGHYQKQEDTSAELAMSVSAHRFAESFEGRENAVKTWTTGDGLRAMLGPCLNTEQVRVPDASPTRTILFLYELVRRPADHVAVVDRDGSLITVLDRAKLATQIAEDQLASHLE